MMKKNYSDAPLPPVPMPMPVPAPVPVPLPLPLPLPVPAPAPAPMPMAARPARATAVLFAVCLAALVLPLSFAGGAVAGPAIARELGASPAAVNWITNAFMLSFGSCLMAAGAMADVFGRKRTFSFGCLLFAIASVAISLMPSVTLVNLLRALQGVAAAAALSGGSAILAQEFDGEDRARAFSLLGTTFGAGLAFGPLMSGALIASLGWRAIFWPGAAMCLGALILTSRAMSESKDPAAAGLDWPGTVAFTGALGLLTWGLLEIPANGLASAPVASLMAASACLFLLFVVIESRTRRPMLDLSLFRYRRFLGIQMLPIATCYCYVVLLVMMPTRLIGIEGLSEIDAGLVLIALSAPMLFVPLAAARASHYLGARHLCVGGLVVAAIGLFLLSRVPAGSGYARGALLPLFIIGMGTGLPWGLMDGLSVTVVPKERAGMAVGIFSTTRVAGEGIALAAVGALTALFIGKQVRTAAPENANGLAIAQRLAGGDVPGALAMIPNAGHDVLLLAYDRAFGQVLYVLIGMTLISALLVFLSLGQKSSTS